MLKLRLNTRTLLSSLPCIAALGLMTPTTTTLAQDYEYEADEGYHEEEWYDPTDWFNDDSNVSYESDDWSDSDDWDYDDDYDWDSDTYGDNDYVYDSTDDYDFSYDYDGYYDGYYDGFYDDDYGYDYWDSTWDTTYSTTFTDGYYDGYYDQTEGYLYEPYYYIGTSTSTDRNNKTSQQRSNDDSRERGDRMSSQSQNQQQGQNRSQRNNRAQQQQTMQQRTGMVRRRGTVKSMTQKNPSQVDDNHTVMQIQFDNGDQVLVDFGPKMTQQQLPFSEWDRITLRGNRVQKDGKSILMVQRISTGDQQINLRSSPNQRSQKTSARGQNNNWNQGNTNRGQNNARQNQGNTNRGQDNRQNQDYTSRQDNRWNHGNTNRGQNKDRQNQRANNNQRGQVSMQGEIESVEKLQSGNQNLTLYRVKLNDSRQCIVALDRQFDERQMNRAEGKDITLQGKRTMVDGRSVIKANSIRFDGEPLLQTRN